MRSRAPLHFAGVIQRLECDLAGVDVVGSSPTTRSISQASETAPDTALFGKCRGALPFQKRSAGRSCSRKISQSLPAGRTSQESPMWSWRRSETPAKSVRFAPPAPDVADAEADEAAG